MKFGRRSSGEITSVEVLHFDMKLGRRKARRNVAGK
jgi:hypothetical protein